MNKLFIPKFFILLLPAILIFAAIYYFKPAAAPSQPASPIVDSSSSEPEEEVIIQPKPELPASFFITVPFTPQAPKGIWDAMHKEACEEASSIMISQYFSKQKAKVLPASLVDEQIKRLIDWEDQYFGYNIDTTASETAQMIEGVYSLKTKLVDNFTEDELKQELVAGRLIIIPENGRLLGNPFYKQPGPIYHMLVIKGYNEQGFITNDSGTKRGESYFYNFDTIYKAAADWDHSKNTVDLNKKTAIVVWE